MRVDLAGAGRAQTTTFAYQGSLTLGGTFANGGYDLQFKLYGQLTGGALQGSPSTVTVSAVTVTAGVFSVDLDFGSMAFPGVARYLEISLRPTGGDGFTTLGPRRQLTSTPYAIRSLNARRMRQPRQPRRSGHNDGRSPRLSSLCAGFQIAVEGISCRC